MADILPNCVPRHRKLVNRGGVMYVPIYCANCGADGGLVPEVACDFAAYLCEPCAEKWSPLFGTMLVPDEVFWRKLHDVQVDEFGRELTNEELVEALKDGDHVITKLARDREHGWKG